MRCRQALQSLQLGASAALDAWPQLVASDVAWGRCLARGGRARPPRAGRLVLAARAVLLVPRVHRLGLYAAAVAPRRAVWPLHDLPAALPPVAVDAPLPRLRRVSETRAENHTIQRTRARTRSRAHTPALTRIAVSFAASAPLTESPRSCRRPRRPRCACATAAPSRRRTRSTSAASARASARDAPLRATTLSSPSTHR